jgi:hypothetical protein
MSSALVLCAKDCWRLPHTRGHYLYGRTDRPQGTSGADKFEHCGCEGVVLDLDASMARDHEQLTRTSDRIGGGLRVFLWPCWVVTRAGDFGRGH